jgi:hypothetical protein
MFIIKMILSLKLSVGVAESTYLRAKKGDPKVSLGVYAMLLFVLGFGDALTDLIDPRKDAQGLLLDIERLPKRIPRRRVRCRHENEPFKSSWTRSRRR